MWSQTISQWSCRYATMLIRLQTAGEVQAVTAE